MQKRCILPFASMVTPMRLGKNSSISPKNAHSASPIADSQRGMTSLCWGTGGRFSMVSLAMPTRTPRRSITAKAMVMPANAASSAESVVPKKFSSASPQPISPMSSSTMCAISIAPAIIGSSSLRKPLYCG